MKRHHLHAWALAFTVTAFGTACVKKANNSAVAGAAEDQDKCKFADIKSKALGGIVGGLIAGVGSVLPVGGEIIGPLSSLVGVVLPGFVGACDINNLRIVQVKADIDDRLGHVTTALNELDAARIKDMLKFYSSSWEASTTNLDAYRSIIFTAPSERAANYSMLFSRYNEMASALRALTDSVRKESSVPFIAAATDLGTIYGYNALKNGDTLLALLYTKDSGVERSTSAAFISSFANLGDAYYKFLAALAERKRTANLPAIAIKDLGGYKIEHAESPLNEYPGPYGHPMPEYKAPKRCQNWQNNTQEWLTVTAPMTITFKNDHTSTFTYEYTAFGGRSGYGQIAGDKMEGTTFQLMARPADLKQRKGFQTFLPNWCQALEVAADSAQIADHAAAAIEVDPKATNAELVLLNHVVEDAKNSFDAIDANHLQFIADFVKSYLTSEPCLGFNATAGEADAETVKALLAQSKRPVCKGAAGIDAIIQAAKKDAGLPVGNSSGTTGDKTST